MNETMLLAADAQAPIMGNGDALQPDAVKAVPVETDVKTCPVCRARLFADMDTCFNCMYRFGSNLALEAKAAERNHAQLRDGAGEVPSAQEKPTMEAGEEECLLSEGIEAARENPASKPSALPERSDERLLSELLVELHGFLGQFLLDRGIDAKQL